MTTETATLGRIYCPMCCRTVEGQVVLAPKKWDCKVVFGQKCPRCCASLDAAAVVGGK